MNSIFDELEMLYKSFLNNQTISMEIFLSILIVGVFIGISFLGLRYKNIRGIFKYHHPDDISHKGDFIRNCLEAPLLSSNGIAMWRIYCSIPLVLLTIIFYKNTFVSSILLLCYVFLFSSDMLDGAVARNKNNITHLGKILDPLADKCLDLPILFIVCLYAENIIFIIMATIIIVIDILGQSLRGKTQNPAANRVGKTKTVLKIISIYVISFNRFDIFLDVIGIILLSASLIFTYYSFFLKVKNI